MAGEKGKRKWSSVQDHGGGKRIVTERVSEKMIEYYRSFVETDFEDRYFREDEFACAFFPGGLARIRDLNNRLRSMVKLAKVFYTLRLQEYDAKDYLEYCYCVANDD